MMIKRAKDTTVVFESFYWNLRCAVQ